MAQHVVMERMDIQGCRNGLLFIIAGVLIYASNEGWLFDWFWWFLGAWGTVLILEGMYRQVQKREPDKSWGLFVWGLILAGFALYQIYNLVDWWPLILISVGLIFILIGLRQTHQTE